MITVKDDEKSEIITYWTFPGFSLHGTTDSARWPSHWTMVQTETTADILCVVKKLISDGRTAINCSRRGCKALPITTTCFLLSLLL